MKKSDVLLVAADGPWPEFCYRSPHVTDINWTLIGPKAGAAWLNQQ